MHPGFTAAEFDHPFQSGHPYPEKFIKVIGKNAKKADSFPERYGFICSFLKYPVIKGKPTDIPEYYLSFLQVAG